MMMKRAVLILLLSTPIYFLLVKGVAIRFHEQDLQEEKRQAEIILENVLDRFRLFLELPYTLGTVGADYFAQGELKTVDYRPFRRLLKSNPEIYGLNVLDAKGKIVRAWPYEENVEALGKTTQNLEKILHSYTQGQKHWLSPPFNLYQGRRGFVFYMPIVRDDKLQGWFAPVVNTVAFSSKFSLQELLHSYEIVIQDAATDSFYFSTALIPADGKALGQNSVTLYGREFRFYCWRKPSQLPRPLSPQLNLLIAAFFSLVTLTLYALFAQKRKARYQLRDIGTLLKLTYQEAQTKLIGLHGEIPATKSDAISYLNNLIEQIDLLQAMTWDEDASYDELVPLLPLLQTQIRFFHEPIESKKLKVVLSDLTPHATNVLANTALLQNAINIVFAHAMILASPQSEILVEISAANDEKTARVNLTVPVDQLRQREEMMERRIEVARRAIEINQGMLLLQSYDHGTKISIVLRLARP